METSAFLESDFYCSHILYTGAFESMPKFFRQEVSGQIRVESVPHLDEGAIASHTIFGIQTYARSGSMFYRLGYRIARRACSYRTI
jgi:hypothetical protein